MSFETNRLLKNLLYGICALCLLLSLTNCTLPTEQEPEEGPATELVVALGRNSLNRSPVDEAIRVFEAKHPHVQVRVRETASLSPMQDLQAEQFEGIDVYIAGTLTAIVLSQSDLLLDLSSITFTPPDPDMADVVEANEYVRGMRSFVPLHIESAMFAINKAALEGTAIRVPDRNWTYYDLAQLLREIKAENLETTVHAPALYGAVVRAFGGTEYDQETSRWRLHTPENIAAFSYLAELLQDDLIKERGGGFISQDTALRIDFLADADRYYLLPYPAGPEGRFSSMSMSTGAMVLSSSAQPDLAVAFIQELTSVEMAKEFAMAGIRPLVDAPEAIDLWRQRVGPDMADLYDLALKGLGSGGRPRVLTPPSSFSYPTELLQRIASGEPVADVLIDIENRLGEAAAGENR